MPSLLIELLSEEIPARMQNDAASTLKKRVTDGLVEAGLTYGGAGAFATPRRLTLSIEDLSEGSQTRREERKGPRVGAPDKAIEGFLCGAGVTRDDLEIRDEKKGQVYVAVIEHPGRSADDIVAEVLEQVIRSFPWPKSMRWGAGEMRWVRPLHSILCVLSDDAGARVVPLSVEGINAGDRTRGHRFMSSGEFSVTSFDDYTSKLKRAHVILSPEERAEHIWNDATNQAFALGLEVVEDRGLLAEVAGLVEWPVVLMGRIDDAFLDLPPEVLQTSMKEHQKFFSVKDPKSGKIVRFVTVANRETTDDGATILAGNQKVLAARLSDAKFFWENDLRVATGDMNSWSQGLENVTFHNKIGTQAARINRIAALARDIAPLVGADPDKAETAARLAKLDLSSEMVGEFPELQGLMGRYYIESAGYSADVAAVSQEHYAPLGPSDDVPTAPLSVAVALADKIDTLTGFWAIDEKPTGSKDPFALRRAALGVIRLILGNGNSLGLLKLFVSHLVRRHNDCEYWVEYLFQQEVEVNVEGKTAEQIWGETAEEFSDNLLGFIHDRLKVYLRDQNIRHDVIDGCLAMPNSDDLTLLVKRADALSNFLKTDDGENLLQGFKRANNILSQAEEQDGVEYSYGADIKFAEHGAEKELFSALDVAEAKITPAMQAEDFTTAMEAMATLRAPTDAFFEAVQVNADSQILRRNRLNLLSRIRTVCLGVADLTRVEG